MKIGLRLNLITSLIMVIIISSLGIYTIKNQKTKVFEDTDVRMLEQVKDLSKIIEMQTKDNQGAALKALDIATRLLQSYGGISVENNLDGSNIWYLNNKNLFENYDFVDEISGLTNAAVTIFEKNSEGYKRISTSLINENGDREVGTMVYSSSEVSKSINEGLDYYGRALVLGEWNLTAYTSIRNNGEIIGMIGVGKKEKDMQGIKKIFNEKKYFISGYPFLVDGHGKLIIHPSKEGENSITIDKIKDAGLESGKLSYEYEGRDKILFFNSVNSIDSYVAVSVYVDELMDIIKSTRRAIVISVFLGILIFVFINTRVSISITKGLNKGVEFAEKIASGDLSTRIDIKQKDEIGLLATSLNKMAENLKVEQYKYKTLFETANDAILILNNQNIFVDCNKKALEMFQCAKEQIIGKTSEDLSPEFQSGKINSFTLALEKKKLAKSGIPQNFEWIHTNLIKSKTFATEVSLNSLIINSNEYLLAIVRDISERKKVEEALKANEEKYRRLTENSPDITYIYSLKRGAQYWSSRVSDILGFDPENLSRDRINWDNAIHIDDRSLIKNFFENIQRGKSHEIEYRIYDIHNKMHWFYDRIFNVYEANGDIVVEGLISDITDKKHAQQKVMHAMINAEERERSRIAKDLHDGVSPVLSAIKLYSQSMRDTQTEKIRLTLSEKIGETINYAITSINEISNNISPHILQHFGLVAAVESFIQKIVNVKNIKVNLKSDLEEKISENIEIALYRITTELINNTLKYANAENITINYVSRNDRVFMSYSDNGKGFDVEEVLKKQKGMGIFNMKSRVIALNGRFEMNSFLKKGTFVELIVPINL